MHKTKTVFLAILFAMAITNSATLFASDPPGLEIGKTIEVSYGGNSEEWRILELKENWMRVLHIQDSLEYWVNIDNIVFYRVL